MRAAVLALVLVVASVGAAKAADISNPVWAQAPSRADWAKAYPAQAAKAGVSGLVKMRCAASATGSLQGCAVVQEAPEGQGFGAAALSLASGMELKPTDATGHSIAGRDLIVPVKFEPSLLKPNVIVANPDWLRQPTQEEVQNYYPAAGDGLAAKVVVSCIVTDRGLLDRCALKKDEPAGHGFGQSVLAMTRIFQMRPMTVDGLPVGGAGILIPVNFAPFDAGHSPVSTLTLIRAAPWIEAPTEQALAAAYPKEAVGKVTEAHVVLRCAFSDDGGLKDCDTVSEEPKGLGFARAARRLTKDFKAIVNAKVDKLKGLRIDVPFDFVDPSRPAPALNIYDPLWLRRPDPSAAAVKLFPPAAIKAGYKAGEAKVDCTVAHDGTLHDCTVAEEDPAGMGFGQAALVIASVMQMNPWTQQGSPVEGAKIELPVKLVLPKDMETPSAGPAAKR